jgi:signal transduction histidine kinase
MDQINQSDHESKRIEELKSFAILDTPPEICFDQFAQLASAICLTPIALISFIDSERQWFKSSFGIQLEQIPRFLTPCNKTITQGDLYEITDMAKAKPDEVVNFMNREGFKFYAGVPITSSEGYNIGTLCVIDHVPRKLNHDQRKNLKVISSQILDLLNIRRMYAKNLLRLKELSATSYNEDKKLLDIAHKSSLRGMAELSAGISFRIRMQVLVLDNVRKRLKELLIPDGSEIKIQLGLLKDSIQSIFLILDSVEKFVIAEQEKLMKPVELSSVIRGVLDQLEHKFKKDNIECLTNLHKDIICIGNLTQLSEVFFAVINNALEAVDGRKDRLVEVSLDKIGHYAIIKVMDNGPGISEKIKPFIFQPFFTTKGVNGLGTGLSLSEMIIYNHSGDIALIHDMNPTIFQISLPVP